MIEYKKPIWLSRFLFLTDKADELKSKILELHPYSTYFGASYTVETLDALYGTPDGVVL